MLILLPPSETKRPGGRGRPLDFSRLAYPSLALARAQVVDALVALSDDEERAARVLGLGGTQRGEVAVNAALRTAPTMRAIDRYTGVLFDALDAGTLDAAARRWLGTHALIHSAPFGPIGALDPIPAYRLGVAVALPGVPALRRVWAQAVTEALAESAPSFVLDLRSEAYVRLGPIPDDIGQAYVRVVTRSDAGEVRALNHFNKHAKGAFVRRLALERPPVRSLRGLLAWADAAGVEMTAGEGRTIQLFAG